MTPEELLKFHEYTCNKLRHIMRCKNADYSGSKLDAFKNFKRITAVSGSTSVEQGFLVRLTDKLGRLGSFIDGNQLLVASESVEDTLDDMINYAILLKAWIHHRQLEELNASIVERETIPYPGSGFIC
ncbi:MAG: nucleotide modification associated domain-containing protein [Lachnospiraceae bacterium]|nr:nucleotide modification associated domain-containing protein [Lachnospiraceae bacterium]